MTIDEKTIEDVEGIFRNFLGKNSIKKINKCKSTADLLVRIIDPIEHADKVVCGDSISVTNAMSYYSGLANICSALSIFCKDRNLSAFYLPKEYKFIITDKIILLLTILLTFIAQCKQYQKT